MASPEDIRDSAGDIVELIADNAELRNLIQILIRERDQLFAGSRGAQESRDAIEILAALLAERDQLRCDSSERELAKRREAGVNTLVFSERPEPPRATDRMDSLWRADIGDAICYHHAAGRPARAAFDGDATNWWESADPDPLIDGIAWIGFDLGPGMSYSVRRFVLWQQVRHAVSRVALQCSDDGFQSDIRTVGDFATPRDGLRNSFAVNANVRARYWRLIARSPVGGKPWRVTGIELWDDDGPLAGLDTS